MKHSLFIITTMALISAFVIQGCDRSSNQMEGTETSVIEAERDRDVEISSSDLQAEVRVYRQEAGNKIMKNNRTIADIKREIESKDSDVRDAHTVRVEELERTNRDLKRQIDNYSHTTQNHWNEFKSDFRTAMDDLGNSLDDFFTTTTTSSN
ncbi:MAG: hypothetical protein JJU13_10960 [Balneolaceae bacterium]|nr:hypothetical protein [Balneolaceae bacterium]